MKIIKTADYNEMSRKAAIVKKAFTGPVTPRVPASILQMHADVTVVCDAAAYAELEKQFLDKSE